MEPKHVGRNLDKAYFSVLVGMYMKERFDVSRRYPSKTKSEAVTLLVAISLGVWSFASTLRAILEFLNTESGDSALRDVGRYGGWWWPYV
jgi:hypothetical protein